MCAAITLTVNGEKALLPADTSVSMSPAMPLLYALRNELGLRNPKFGCGLGQCGLCTVIIDGNPVRSCQITLREADGLNITTLEGLANNGQPHPVQQAFIEEWAGQCSYCVNGWLMTAVALLERQPDATEQQIRSAFTGLKCRCAMQLRYIAAAKRVVASRTPLASETAGL